MKDNSWKTGEFNSGSIRSISMQFRIENVLHMPPERFWELFFDSNYNQAMYYGCLQFSHFDIPRLEYLENGRIERDLEGVPPYHAPAAVKKLINGALILREKGYFDASEQRWYFHTTPSVLPKRVTVKGYLHAVPHDSGAMHIMDVTAEVRLWGVGGLVERTIESNTREQTGKMIEFTNQYAQQAE